MLGFSAAVAPADLTLVPAMPAFDIAGTVAQACLPIFFTSGRVARPKGPCS